MEKMTDGSDIIFAVGVPGSKWSRILTVLGFHPEINSSDLHKFPTYFSMEKFTSGKTRKVGTHTGSYFGPGNLVGNKFDKLHELTKEEFLQELYPCFDNWDQGIKIIKSHWFSYNIDWLVENFPKAKIVIVYNGNAESFKWWQLVGGWNITFPNYTWYQNDERMWQQIQKENQLILDFMRRKKIDFDVVNMESLVEKLGLPTEEFLNILEIQKNKDPKEAILYSIQLGACVSVYDPDADNNSILDDNINAINYYVANKHQVLEVDELLSNKYGNEWLNNINLIISKGKL